MTLKRQDKSQGTTRYYGHFLRSHGHHTSSLSSNFKLQTSNSPFLIILTRSSLPTTRHNQVFLRHGISDSTPLTALVVAAAVMVATPTMMMRPASAPDSVQPPNVVWFGQEGNRDNRERNQIAFNLQRPRLFRKTSPKKWEDMNMTEKAMELYMGEKGVLFWLPKFAFASIFIMIGICGSCP